MTASRLRPWLLGALLAAGPPAPAAVVYVGGNANAVPIVDQHPLARGEALYDNAAGAAGLYNRNVDTTAARYDRLPDYWINTPQGQLISLINGGWYCAPTSALSLVQYWDQVAGANGQPRFPNLFGPTDTARSVILDLARRMDTDDLTVRGGFDPREFHRGTLPGDVLPGTLGYFNQRYPNQFAGGQLALPANPTAAQLQAFGQLYDALINRGIPVLLGVPGHMTVGIGYDNAFGFNDPRHYHLNDPWNAAADITAAQLGRGRPNFQGRVFGGEGDDDFPFYDEGPWGLSPGGLPLFLAWVEPADDLAGVPEPRALALAGLGAAGLVLLRRRRR